MKPKRSRIITCCNGVSLFMRGSSHNHAHNHVSCGSSKTKSQTALQFSWLRLVQQSPLKKSYQKIKKSQQNPKWGKGSIHTRYSVFSRPFKYLLFHPFLSHVLTTFICMWKWTIKPLEHKPYICGASKSSWNIRKYKRGKILCVKKWNKHI